MGAMAPGGAGLSRSRRVMAAAHSFGSRQPGCSAVPSRRVVKQGDQSAAFGTDKPLACRHHRAKSRALRFCCLSVGEESSGADMTPSRILDLTRGTDGSNPFPCSEESGANSVRTRDH